jgi:hypothetical protein
MHRSDLPLLYPPHMLALGAMLMATSINEQASKKGGRSSLVCKDKGGYGGGEVIKIIFCSFIRWSAFLIFNSIVTCLLLAAGYRSGCLHVYQIMSDYSEFNTPEILQKLGYFAYRYKDVEADASNKDSSKRAREVILWAKL